MCYNVYIKQYNCMTNVIKSWDISRGDVYFLGSTVFKANDVASFRKDEVEAIRSLCKKALESETGRTKASEAYALNGRITFAVGFNDKKGLCLLLNGVEHRVATSDEVYSGKLPVLDEIKKIQAAAERQNIGSVRRNVTAAVQETDKKIKTVYDRCVKICEDETKSPSLMGRVLSHIEKFWMATGFASIVRNSIELSVPAKNTALNTAFKCIVIIGGCILAAAGIGLVLSGADALSLALLNKSHEKAVLAFMDILMGLSAMMTGIFFMAQRIAQLLHKVVAAALAGALLPIGALCLYIVSLISSIYKLIVRYKFRSELKEILGNGHNPEKLLEALKWIRQKTQLSEMEVKELQFKANKDDGNFAKRVKHQLQQKWDKFATRVESEALVSINEELNNSLLNLDGLIAKIEKENLPDSESITLASGLIQGILEKNREELKWNIVSIIASIIGLFGVITCLAFTGVSASQAASALFVIAALISIFVDAPKMRAFFGRRIKAISKFIKKKIESIEKIEYIAAAVFSLNAFTSINEGQKAAVSLMGRVADSAIRAYDEDKRNGCSKSRARVKEEPCANLSVTSSIFFDRNEAFRRTQSRRTGVISPLSQAS